MLGNRKQCYPGRPPAHNIHPKFCENGLSSHREHHKHRQCGNIISLWFPFNEGKWAKSGIAQSVYLLGCGLDDRGVVVHFLTRARGFSLQRPDRVWGPSSLQASSSGVKWSGCDANDSPFPRAELKDEWICAASPRYALLRAQGQLCLVG